MSAPVTARELEAARKVCPCWGDDKTGPRECGDGRVCELHYHIAQALAAADAAGYERGRSEKVQKAAVVWADAFEAYFYGTQGAAQVISKKRAEDDLLAAIRASAGPDGRET